jgi:hypothetical protein
MSSQDIVVDPEEPKMNTLVGGALSVAAFFLVANCASRGVAHDGLVKRSCETSSAAGVFDHPLQFDGKQFCGRVFAVARA